MNKVNELLNQLENKIPFSEKINQEVSQVNIAWHLEHSLLTLDSITDFLIRSNPKDYKKSFNFIRAVVLTLKKIPRGRAQSPQVVQPKGAIEQSHLQKHLETTRNKIKELESLPKNKYFNHPIFGKLTQRQTITFLEIHTSHHLKIVNDILKK